MMHIYIRTRWTIDDHAAVDGKTAREDGHTLACDHRTSNDLFDVLLNSNEPRDMHCRKRCRWRHRLHIVVYIRYDDYDINNSIIYKTRIDHEDIYIYIYMYVY
jgi:hypothetical protein